MGSGAAITLADRGGAGGRYAQGDTSADRRLERLM